VERKQEKREDRTRQPEAEATERNMERRR